MLYPFYPYLCEEAYTYLRSKGLETFSSIFLEDYRYIENIATDETTVDLVDSVYNLVESIGKELDSKRRESSTNKMYQIAVHGPVINEELFTLISRVSYSKISEDWEFKILSNTFCNKCKKHSDKELCERCLLYN